MKATWFLAILLTGEVLAGPGEVGRPKVIPTFEKWGDEILKRRTGSPGSVAEQGDLVFHNPEGHPTKLKTLWKDKPVLIVHSSLTCPVSRDNCPHVDRLQTQYGRQIEVVVLYTTEAHPVGSPSPYSEGGKLEWITDRNLVENILVDEPNTIESRLKRARDYRKQQQIQSRMVVDNMDNSIWKAFGGGPNTGIFIATNGQVIARQGWLRPSEMTGEIRSYFAALTRKEVREKIKKHGHELDEWSLDLTQIEKAAKDVPEVLSFNLNSRGVCDDEMFLHQAVKRNEPEIVARLLELGAPPNGLDRRGLTPLHYALRNLSEEEDPDNSRIIELLLAKDASLTLRSDQLLTATHFAVNSGTVSKVQLALAKGAPLDRYSIDGISPLHEALYQGRQDIAETLLAKGASIDLFAAAGLGDMTRVKRFLGAKTDAWNSYQGRSGRSSLMYAAINGKIEIVRFLLSRQSDEQHYANKQLVACLKAANQSGQEQAALLIARQARPLQGDFTPGSTQSLIPLVPPLEGYDEILANPLIHEVAGSGHSRLLATLLLQAWDVDAFDPDEWTPLHWAAFRGAPASILVLLERGADKNAQAGTPRMLPCGPPDREPEKKTPLHLAVERQEIDCVRILVERGVALEINDRKGKTPICYALPNSPSVDISPNEQVKKLEEIIELLSAAGVNPDKPSECGKSLRDLASEMLGVMEDSDEEWLKFDGSHRKFGDEMRKPEVRRFLTEIADK